MAWPQQSPGPLDTFYSAPLIEKRYADTDEFLNM